MAYINEFVSAKERRTFKNSYGSEISTRFWTIDRQRDYILFNYFEDREPPHDNSFIFYYKGFTLVLRVSQRIFTEPNIITWRLLSVSIPKQLDKKELFKELESAFATVCQVLKLLIIVSILSVLKTLAVLFNLILVPDIRKLKKYSKMQIDFFVTKDDHLL